MEDWVDLGGGVYVRRYAFLDQSIGLVVGDGEALVVDTRSTARQAEELLEDIRRITPAPVTTAVDTHGHYDHAFGNRTFRPAAIWGHVRCREMLERTDDQELARLASKVPEIADDLMAVVVDPPDRTFRETAGIEVGGRPIGLFYRGRGHTDNDVVIVVDEPNVVFVGDLLENGAPPWFGDSYPLEWGDTAASVCELIQGVVVPGHGDPAGRAFARQQTNELIELGRLARRIHAGEIELEAGLRDAPFGADAAREPIERALAQLGPRPS